MVAEKVAMSLYKNRGQTDIAECPLLVRIIMIHVSFIYCLGCIFMCSNLCCNKILYVLTFILTRSVYNSLPCFFINSIKSFYNFVQIIELNACINRFYITRLYCTSCSKGIFYRFKQYCRFILRTKFNIFKWSDHRYSSFL